MGVSLAAGGVVLMPTWKRAMITGIQLSMTLITAGVIIGYGQLYNLLVTSNVYQYKCKGQPTPPPLDNGVCPEQAAALDQLFNIGASVSIFIQAPSGVILDFLGPRITCWAGLALFVPGCFIFAFADSITHVDAYMIGFQLLAAGGPFVFISSLPVSQLWPDKQAMILMMINGVYGGGAFVFFLFSVLYNHAHLSMRDLFIGYGVLGGVMAIIAGFVWPRKSYASNAPTSNIQENEDGSYMTTTFEILSKSLKDVCTVHFWYLALFVMFLIFKSNFFLSTYNSQFGLFLSDAQVEKYNTVFGVLLPAVGILAGPIGLFFDKFGVNSGLILVILLSTFSSVCGLMVYSVEIFGAFQIVRMIVFSVFFPMIYGVWAFSIIAKYGNTNFGVLYGIIAILAGILNITLANPVNQRALKEKSYVHVNFFLAVIGFCFIFYPLTSGILACRQKSRSGYQPIESVQ